ncbi:MAG: hypothetical protein AB1791_18080 [Chloroflexota bacterium]
MSGKDAKTPSKAEFKAFQQATRASIFRQLARPVLKFAPGRVATPLL